MKSTVFQLFFRLLALSNIAIDDDQLDDFTVLVADRVGDRLEGAPLSVLVADAILQPFAKSGSASFLGRLQDLKAVVGMDLFEGGSFGQFGGRVAQDSFVGRTVVEAPS